MEDVYALKQFSFLGKPVTYVCQNINGPCPLLAICNVLLLRGHLVLPDDRAPHISAQELMRLVHKRLVDMNPPLSGENELARLTHIKTMEDVTALLPSLLVGLDVNVRFHNITDFEYTVACAVFDMLDIALVHGWLLDLQDDRTMNVVQNKSYNELVELFVDYRAVLMTEPSSSEEPAAAPAAPDAGDSVDASDQAKDEDMEEYEEKHRLPPSPPPISVTDATTSVDFDSLTIDADSGAVSPASSTCSQRKSPSRQTVQVLMNERHISDADALSKATAILEDGPVLEEFLNSTASQLTYYGLVKLHEGVRERQLCVFFRNNHFSTLFKYDGALYLLVTDAGYLDEPNVVWERLNDIDGDTEYLDAQFRSLNVSETRQQTIISEQEKARSRQIQEANGEQLSADQSGEMTGDMDPDFLFALRLQQQEEAIAKRVSPSGSPRGVRKTSGANASHVSEAEAAAMEQTLQEANESDEDLSSIAEVQQYERVGNDSNEPSENESFPMTVDGEIVLTEEELEAQRRAERYYQEQKRMLDQQAAQHQMQPRRQSQQQQQQAPSRASHSAKSGSDCTLM